MERAYIAVGANLGDREETIAEAIRRLGALGTVAAVSPLIETPAWPDPAAAPPYLNGAIALDTALGPHALVRGLLAVEASLGRRRSVPNAPRTIDLDLLLHGDRVIASPDLVLPHPRMHQRRFVLEPLAAIAPEAVHPVWGRRLAEFLAGTAAGRARPPGNS
ncbi:MAG: 2-amino-4-hydroxy-6-hydroxymethyldihydropteridine diphosphokinase [Chloroflexota bacterium]